MFSAQSEFDPLCATCRRIHDETRERIRTFFFIGIHVKQTVHLYRFADVVFGLDHHIENFRIHHRRAQTRQIDDARILLFGKQRVFSLSRQSFCAAGQHSDGKQNTEFYSCGGCPAWARCGEIIDYFFHTPRLRFKFSIQEKTINTIM